MLDPNHETRLFLISCVTKQESAFIFIFPAFIASGCGCVDETIFWRNQTFCKNSLLFSCVTIFLSTLGTNNQYLDQPVLADNAICVNIFIQISHMQSVVRRLQWELIFSRVNKTISCIVVLSGDHLPSDLSLSTIFFISTSDTDAFTFSETASSWCRQRKLWRWRLH